jgi:hypothetical protein
VHHAAGGSRGGDGRRAGRSHGVKLVRGEPADDCEIPQREFDLGNLNDGPAGAVCAFPVNALILAIGPGHAIFFDGQGVGFGGMTFGALKLTITNMDTGASATVNISGPGGITGDGLPVLGRGPWVIFEPIGEGGIRLFRGLTRFVPVSYGVHGISIAGTEEDLCHRVA